MHRGRIEVITGGMFSGKSEELVRRLRRATFARKKVRAFKHSSDDRYHDTHIGCHSGIQFDALPKDTAFEILAASEGADVVGIDEAQFFHPGLVEVCEKLANTGKRVVVAGLDLDSEGHPFGPMPHLMAIAEDVDKLHAVCMVCGERACRSQHKAGKTELVEVGAAAYEARCRGCWTP